MRLDQAPMDRPYVLAHTSREDAAQTVALQQGLDYVLHPLVTPEHVFVFDPTTLPWVGS